MIQNYAAWLQQSPDPETATIRLERLLEDETANRCITKIPQLSFPFFIHLITISNFLFRYFCRHPDTIGLLYGTHAMDRAGVEIITDVNALRSFKYQELVKITWLDLTNNFSYKVVLDRLSILADNVILKAMQITSEKIDYPCNGQQQIPFCVFAMGKLGANELNYSSDVDLIFVSRNDCNMSTDLHAYQEGVLEHIRRFSQIMQDISADGFLYRVDLNLRPWGRSGPLVLSVDATEHYYEASTEASERFAWLRARIIGGEKTLGEDLLRRLGPFIYLRTLSSDELQRFITIKNDIAKQRRKSGSWNV